MRFVTFGDGSFDYRMAARRLAREARKTGLFSSVSAFDLASLRDRYPNFISEHRDFILNNPRGMGFWLWKPFLIKQELIKAQEDEIIVYCDSGCELNIAGIEALTTILPRVNEDCSIIKIENHSVRSWTNTLCLEYLKTDPAIYSLPQLAAGIIIIRNNREITNIINRWFQLATVNQYSLLIDRPKGGQDRSFIEHRHDQSLYTIIIYCAIAKEVIRPRSLIYSRLTRNSAAPISIAWNRTGVRPLESPPFWYRIVRRAYDVLLNKLIIKRSLRLPIF